MTDLTEIEEAWCDWMQRFRGNRSGDPAPVASFKAGAAYECARIRRELLVAIEQDTVSLSWDLGGGNRARGVDNPYVTVDDLRAALDRIAPELSRRRAESWTDGSAGTNGISAFGRLMSRETEGGGFYGPVGPEEHEELLRLAERVRELEAENLALVAVIGNIANAAVDSAVRGMKED